MHSKFVNWLVYNLRIYEKLFIYPKLHKYAPDLGMYCTVHEFVINLLQNSDIFCLFDLFVCCVNYDKENMIPRDKYKTINTLAYPREKSSISLFLLICPTESSSNGRSSISTSSSSLRAS